MLNIHPALREEDVRALLGTWIEYAEVTAVCAPAAAEAYRRCAGQLRQALGIESDEYPLAF